jgi:hypothetical protein
MTIETDPIPRGFALPLVVLAIGFACHGRLVWASIAASAGLLFHAPTTIPFWIVFLWIVARRREWRALIPLAAGAAFFAVLWRFQQPGTESPPLFGRIDAAWEKILRFRSSYAFVSMWPVAYWAQHLVLAAIAGLATYRLRERLGEGHRAFFIGFPVIGGLSLPVSWLLLDRAKWALMAQFQPARWALFITLAVMVVCTIAGIEAARDGRRIEATVWLAVTLALVVHPNPTRSWLLVEVAFVLVPAVLFAVTGPLRLFGPAVIGLLVVCLVGFAMSSLGHGYYPRSVDRLCTWGMSLPADAVFAFPDAGRNLDPGVFRARTKHAVYVDWKAGGQANFFRDLAVEWQRRWDEIMISPSDDPQYYRTRGIDYVVRDLHHPMPGLRSEFYAGPYIVYRIP